MAEALRMNDRTGLVMSGHELAFVEDVGFLTTKPRGRGSWGYVKSGWDLRITESELTLSLTGETLVVGGRDTLTIPFTEIKHIRIKKDKRTGFYILTVSYFRDGRHWWNSRGVGKVVLREFQFAQVIDALNGLPALKERLSI